MMRADHPDGPETAQGSAISAVAARQRFDAMLPRVATRLLGEGEAARVAAAQGGFVLGDSTVVMRLNEASEEIEFFCDIGLPLPQALETSQRAALELNLCRSYPGVVFGMHPESGRLVATTSLQLPLVADDEACLNTLRRLTGICHDLRSRSVFIVVDERPEH